MTTDHRLDRITREQLARETSRKWSLHPDTVGAWVAEMDFGTAPEVTAALSRAIAEGVLGYLSASLSADMSAATAEWCDADYGWQIDPRHVHPVSDVMAALGIAVTRYSPEGSAVIVPTPAYMPFLTYLPSIGRPVIQVPGTVDEGRWRHDLDAIEDAFLAGARTLVLCNPHNPTGTVLTRDELEQLAGIVERHGGRVFADEIHAPLRYDGRDHIPYASLSDATAAHTITGMSASKAWNIPGLKCAQLVTSNDPDESAYARFGFAFQHGASTLGVIATTAAYRHGGAWRDDVVDYLDGNRRLLGDLLQSLTPSIEWIEPDATYLGWLDCRAIDPPGSPADFFRAASGVTLTDGGLCGTGFEGYVRLVFAMPRPILRSAVTAMAESVEVRAVRSGAPE